MSDNLHESKIPYTPKKSSQPSEKTDVFSGITSVTLNKIGIHTLKKPLSFKSFYATEDNLYCIESDELSLHGYGETYQEALCDLADDLDTYARLVFAYPDDKCSAKSVADRKKVEEYADLNEIAAYLKKQDND
ncbi:MAG TPA: hypothetical protein O0X70_05590 [Methanocorpusculum sp.]|nr:hypothetical protein [Methanocorpusculum sp.]